MIDSRTKDMITVTHNAVVSISEEVKSLKRQNEQMLEMLRAIRLSVVRKYNKKEGDVS